MKKNKLLDEHRHKINLIDYEIVSLIDERMNIASNIGKIKQKNGMLSLKTTSEIDCKNLKIRDNEYFAFKERMGKGENFYSKKHKGNWKSSKKGTSVYFLNQVLCDRVLK